MNAPKEPSSTTVLPLAVVFYAAMLACAWLWLWLRERADQVSILALGAHGAMVAAGAGLAAGVLGALAIAAASRWLPAVRACEQRIAELLGPLTEAQILQLAMVSAIAEETFFRVAMQDAFGFPVAVAVYAGLSTGPGFWAWAPVAAGSAAVFGGLLTTGAGLLAATAAHAIVTYLFLRRIVST